MPQKAVGCTTPSRHHVPVAVQHSAPGLQPRPYHCVSLALSTVKSRKALPRCYAYTQVHHVLSLDQRRPSRSACSHTARGEPLPCTQPAMYRCNALPAICMASSRECKRPESNRHQCWTEPATSSNREVLDTWRWRAPAQGGRRTASCQPTRAQQALLDRGAPPTLPPHAGSGFLALIRLRTTVHLQDTWDT